MRSQSLRTPLVVLGLVVSTVMVLRAADDKNKVKDSDIPPPGTIKFAAAPAAVQKTFKDETKNAKIELLGKGTLENKVNFYRAIVPVGSNDYDMAVAENGQILEKMMHPVRSEIKFEECPAVVQKALKEELKGAKVEAVERVTAGKRADYTMDVVVQKVRYMVTFTEDGTLMSKMFDDSESNEAVEEAPKKISEKPEKASKSKK
jgi:hypothetical protein